MILQKIISGTRYSGEPLILDFICLGLVSFSDMEGQECTILRSQDYGSGREILLKESSEICLCMSELLLTSCIPPLLENKDLLLVSSNKCHYS